MVKYYDWSVLFKDVKIWALKTGSHNLLEAFEMWIYLRMLKISCATKTTNEETLRRAKNKRQLTIIIKRRKIVYLDHILRGDKYMLFQTIM